MLKFSVEPTTTKILISHLPPGTVFRDLTGDVMLVCENPDGERPVYVRLQSRHIEYPDVHLTLQDLYDGEFATEVLGMFVVEV